MQDKKFTSLFRSLHHVRSPLGEREIEQLLAASPKGVAIGSSMLLTAAVVLVLGVSVMLYFGGRSTSPQEVHRPERLSSETLSAQAPSSESLTAVAPSHSTTRSSDVSTPSTHVGEPSSVAHHNLSKPMPVASQRSIDAEPEYAEEPTIVRVDALRNDSHIQAPSITTASSPLPIPTSSEDEHTVLFGFTSSPMTLADARAGAEYSLTPHVLLGGSVGLHARDVTASVASVSFRDTVMQSNGQEIRSTIGELSLQHRVSREVLVLASVRYLLNPIQDSWNIYASCGGGMSARSPAASLGAGARYQAFGALWLEAGFEALLSKQASTSDLRAGISLLW